MTPLAFLGPLGPLAGRTLLYSPKPPATARERLGGRPGTRSARPASRSAPRRAHVRPQLERAAVRHVRARSTSTRSSRSVAHRVARAVERRAPAARSGLAAVAAWARRHIGGPYVSGGSGAGGGYDCSGFTRAAYAAAGIPLPHQSGAQAARTRPVSRSAARPGDLVIGNGHVGIYAGGGMMWDAGNHRVGVSYRPMYGGLRIGRVL